MPFVARNLLAIHKLDAFTAWLDEQGIEHRPTNAAYQVLQVRVVGDPRWHPARGVFWIWPGEPVKYSKAPPAYSTDWAQGGPIIERERISTEWSSLWDCWTARDLRNAAFSFTGPTPLIAAMRSYVASKFGDEVAVPDELLS